jgi:hypothetical protein
VTVPPAIVMSPVVAWISPVLLAAPVPGAA